MHAAMRSALFGSALPFAGWDLALGFRDAWYRSGGLVTRDVTALPTYGFTRAGARFEPAGGAFVPVEAGRPAVLPGVGYVARPAYTNLVANSSAAGAAIGVTPTRWQNAGASSSQVVGIGTEAGLPYVDIRVQVDGTQTGVRFHQIIPGSQADYAAGTAAAGDSFYASVVLKLLAGAWPSVSSTLQLREFNDTFAYQQTTSVNVRDVGAQAVTKTVTGPVKSSGTTRVYTTIEIQAPAGEVVDLTLRIYGWTLMRNQSGGPFVPTTAGAVTAADDRMTFAAPIPADEDHVVMAKVNLAVPAPAAGSGQTALTIFSSSSASNSIGMNRFNGGGVSVVARKDGAGVVNLFANGAQPGTGPLVLLYARRAGRYVFAYRNSAGVVGLQTSGVADFPVGLDRLVVGAGLAAGSSNGADSPVELLAYRRGTFSDDQLRAMVMAA